MAWDGNGNYVLSGSYYPEVNGTTIDATRYNGLMTDLQGGLNNTLARDGQVAFTADLSAGGFKLTNLAAATTAGNAVRFEQVQRNGVATLASSGTTELGSSASGTITISGTTTITSFGSTAETGQIKQLIFSGTLTLTYNATSMILPGAANITTAAGDSAIAVHLGSGNWRVVAYSRISGSTVLGYIPIAAGSVGAAGLPLISDNDTGFYSVGANQLGVTAGGVNRATFAAATTITGSTSVTVSAPTATLQGSAAVTGGTANLVGGTGSSTGGAVNITGGAGTTTGGDIVITLGNGGTTKGDLEIDTPTGTAWRFDGGNGKLIAVDDAGKPTASEASCGVGATINGNYSAFILTIGTAAASTVYVNTGSGWNINSIVVATGRSGAPAVLSAGPSGSAIYLELAAAPDPGDVYSVLLIDNVTL